MTRDDGDYVDSVNSTESRISNKISNRQGPLNRASRAHSSEEKTCPDTNLKLILNANFINNVKLDLTDQNVINLDCKRTRGFAKEKNLESKQSQMEKIITCYCKINDINYIQGMNEVSITFYDFMLAHKTVLLVQGG